MFFVCHWWLLLAAVRSDKMHTFRPLTKEFCIISAHPPLPPPAEERAEHLLSWCLSSSILSRVSYTSVCERAAAEGKYPFKCLVCVRACRKLKPNWQMNAAEPRAAVWWEETAEQTMLSARRQLSTSRICFVMLSFPGDAHWFGGLSVRLYSVLKFRIRPLEA